MADPTVKAVEELPKMMREAVKKHIIAGTPLRVVAEMCGLSHETIRRYREQKIRPNLDPLDAAIKDKVLTAETAEDKRLVREAIDKAVASCDKANFASEVQRETIALRERAKNTLTRIESRPDEEFNGREWASVATVVARTIETHGQLTGELRADRGAGGVSIQIVVPSSAPAIKVADEPLTIDIDPIKG